MPHSVASRIPPVKSRVRLQPDGGRAIQDLRRRRVRLHEMTCSIGPGGGISISRSLPLLLQGVSGLGTPCVFQVHERCRKRLRDPSVGDGLAMLDSAGFSEALWWDAAQAEAVRPSRVPANWRRLRSFAWPGILPG